MLFGRTYMYYLTEIISSSLLPPSSLLIPPPSFILAPPSFPLPPSSSPSTCSCSPFFHSSILLPSPCFGPIYTRRSFLASGNFVDGANLNEWDAFGSSVAAIGDINQDGIVELFIGCASADDGYLDASAAYVIFLAPLPTESPTESPTGPCPSKLPPVQVPTSGMERYK